jgi:hypothetical protein
MRELAGEISDLVTSRGNGVAFPGRLRIFCEDSLAGLLPERWREGREYPHASGPTLLASAIGAAWAEHRRGGGVVVIVHRSALDQGLWWEAADLAGHLHWSHVVVLLAGGTDNDCKRLVGCAWRDDRVGDAPDVPGPRVRLAAEPEFSASQGGAPTVRCIGDWPPVHLDSMPQGALPPWPLGDGPAGHAVDRWLGWLGQREPRLLLPHAMTPWNGLPDTPAKLLALAQLAGEGWRVCWRLQAPGSLIDWLGVLDAVGRRGLPLKIVLEHSDLTPLTHLQALPGWWVLAPSDLGETSAVMAHALDNEHSTIIALPGAGRAIPTWPNGQAYMPGTGRSLVPGSSLTLVCDSAGAQVACEARTVLETRGMQAEVYHCTSLHPLPSADLEACAGRAPLLVCAQAAPALTGAINAILCALGAPHHAHSVHASDHVPEQSLIVARAVELMTPGRSPGAPTA